MTGFSDTNCPDVSYSLEVLIEKKPIADAGGPISICEGTISYQVNDADATNYDTSVSTNINWSLTGPATHNNLSTINLENNTLQSRIRIPFDPLDGIVNNQGTIGYVQENNGSQVGNFDLVSGKLIEQSSAGRFFKQVLVNSRKTVLKVLIVGLVPAVVEMIFSLNNSKYQLFRDNVFF